MQTISVIGLGYVGLPIAAAFSEHTRVIGFDVNEEKIKSYQNGIDVTDELGNERLRHCAVEFTADPSKLREASFYIVAVPTPVGRDKTPDLRLVIGASRIVGQNLQKGSIVVYESTVYPGVTEEICVPVLEKESGLRCGVDFKVGYSPERINPSDAVHRLDNITKIVSGMDEDALSRIAETYELIVKAGVYLAPSIKIAESAKVIENCQRDINVAFMNELSIIFNKMNIDTLEVLKAAGTKWNFLNFRPGLVGGHCIGVDPYYLTYCAEQFGYHSQVILAGRRINDDMGKYVAENVVKLMIKNGKQVAGSRVAIFGLTFKENCRDTRNTRVVDIILELKEYGISPIVCDPVADKQEALREYGISLSSSDAIDQMDAVIIAVGHKEFLTMDFAKMLSQGSVFADIKGVIGPLDGVTYWRL